MGDGEVDGGDVLVGELAADAGDTILNGGADGVEDRGRHLRLAVVEILVVEAVIDIHQEIIRACLQLVTEDY